MTRKPIFDAIRNARGKGWLRRVDEVEQAALELAA